MGARRWTAVVASFPTFALALLALLALAGCAADEPSGKDRPQAEPGAGEGTVRGFVVDEAIRPVAGAAVAVRSAVGGAGAPVQAETDARGEFALALPAGAYLLEASHARFAPTRSEVQVAEGFESSVVLQFEFPAEMAPYHTTEKWDGFVVCSLSTPAFTSEECGEGVGTPAGRVGKQANNLVRHDFGVDSTDLQTLVVEVAWSPTSEAGTSLVVYTVSDWVCDPECDGNDLGTEHGTSPIHHRVDRDALLEELEQPEPEFSVFVLADDEAGAATLVLNQPFQVFVSKFYRDAAPEGFSFLQQATLA